MFAGESRCGKAHGRFSIFALAARGGRWHVDGSATNALRSLAGLCLLLTWVPILAAISLFARLGSPAAALWVLFAFGATASISSAISLIAERSGAFSPFGIGRFAAMPLGAIGSLGMTLGISFESTEMGMAFAIPLGVSIGLSSICWGRVLGSLKPAMRVLRAIASVTSYSSIAWLVIGGGSRLAGLLGLAGCASMLLCVPCVPNPEEHVLRSRLLDLQTDHFLRRYVASFFVTGAAITGIVLTFLSARFAVIAPSSFFALLFGGPAFAVVCACSWIPKREHDFGLVLRFSFVFALFALFPIAPGTRFSADMALGLCMLWVPVALGALLVVSGAVNGTFRPWPETSGMGLAAFMGGVAAGSFASYLWMRMDAFEEAAAGTFEGILIVSACTLGSLTLIFCATNMSVSASSLRKVRLTAQGRIPQTMSVASGGEVRESPSCSGGSQADFIEEAMRRIAFDKGLTPREHDVLQILGRGNTLARVQSDLVISEGTAITHRRNIYRKLSVHSKQELIDFVCGYRTEGDPEGERESADPHP